MLRRRPKEAVVCCCQWRSKTHQDSNSSPKGTALTAGKHGRTTEMEMSKASCDEETTGSESQCREETTGPESRCGGQDEKKATQIVTGAVAWGRELADQKLEDLARVMARMVSTSG